MLMDASYDPRGGILHYSRQFVHRCEVSRSSSSVALDKDLHAATSSPNSSCASQSAHLLVVQWR